MKYTAPNTTVAIPTVGRVEMLTRCVESILDNTVLPAEILIVNQASDAIAQNSYLQSEFKGLARFEKCDRKGLPANLNMLLELSTHDIVFVTHDDCVVDEDWIRVGLRHFNEHGGIVTGRVSAPFGVDPATVPSLNENENSRDFSGCLEPWHLYPNNMVLDKNMAIEIGGFDESIEFSSAGEDLDFCFRWMEKRLPVRYEPDFRVIHYDWRTAEELRKVYKRYARSAGAFYAKHLKTGKFVVLTWMRNSLFSSMLAWKKYLGSKAINTSDELRMVIPHMLIGFFQRLFRRE